MKLFVTGAAGFIGSNYVRQRARQQRRRGDDLRRAHLRRQPRHDPRPGDDPRVVFVQGDICDRDAVLTAMDGHDAVVHFAAESHVDRSIARPDEFVRTNCYGTNVLCDVARQVGVERFVHISTDEVYGSIDVGSFAETDRLGPRSPYSAARPAATSSRCRT